MSGSRIAKSDLLRLARALGDELADTDELAGESIGCIFERCMQRAEQLNSAASTYPFGDDPAHPIVRDWARRVVDGAVEHVLSCRMGENEAERFAMGWVDSAVRRHAAIDPATCSHTMRLGRCVRCDQRPPTEPLSNVESECRGRGHDPGPCVRDSREAVCRWCMRAMPACEHAGELAIDRATGEESCTDCESEEPTLTQAEIDVLSMKTRPPTVDDLSDLRPAAHVERVRRLLEEEPGRDRRANAEQWAKTKGNKGAQLNG